MVRYVYDGSDELDQHSIVKHEVIYNYMLQYISVYFQSPRTKNLNIDIFDVFSGGGKFKNGRGSPLRFMDACLEGAARACEKWRGPRTVNPNFYFNDIDPNATSLLSKTISETHKYLNYRATYLNEDGAKFLDFIVQELGARQGRGRRVIVFLDPYDLSTISIEQIREVSKYNNSEVFWVLMTDHAFFYATEKNSNFELTLKRMGVPESVVGNLLSEIVKFKNAKNWNYLRYLFCKTISELSGFKFKCFFPIRQIGSQKDYSLVHLSHSPKARQVILEVYWDNCNYVQEFYFNGIKYISPAYSLKNEIPEPLFSFSDHERKSMRSLIVPEIVDNIDSTQIIPIEYLNKFFAGRYSAVTQNDFTHACQESEDMEFVTATGRETKSVSSAVGIRRRRQFSIFDYLENKNS